MVNTDDQLHVDPLERLRQRRSAKWQTYPRDVVPLTVAEMDFALAPGRVRGTTRRRRTVGHGLRDARPRPRPGGGRLRRQALELERRPYVGHSRHRCGGRRSGTAPRCQPARGCSGHQPPGLPAVLRLGPRGWGPDCPKSRWSSATANRALDLDGLERAFAAHPAAYVLCNPQNPVGTVHSPEELEALVQTWRRSTGSC